MVIRNKRKSFNTYKNVMFVLVNLITTLLLFRTGSSLKMKGMSTIKPKYDTLFSQLNSFLKKKKTTTSKLHSYSAFKSMNILDIDDKADSNSNEDSKESVNDKKENKNYEYHYLWYNKDTSSFNYLYSKNEVSDTPKNGILSAKLRYSKSIKTKGWHRLHIKTFNDDQGISNSLLQCYSAGYLEGRASYLEMYYYFNNIHVFFKDYGKEGMEKVYNVLEKIYNSLVSKLSSPEYFESIKDNEKELKKWTYISCITSQFEGLYNGYSRSLNDNKLLTDQEKKKMAITIIDLLLVNSEGNYGDLKAVADYSSDKDLLIDNENFADEENLIKVFKTSDINMIWKNLMKSSHCSVLIKLIKKENDNYDIISGHDTWSNYSELLRTLKTYEFEFDSVTKNKENASLLDSSKKISFSSYPGVLFSGDDFYVLDNKVALVQTTLNVINQAKYKNLIDFDNYIPEFMRIMTTNYLSTSGSSWVEEYKNYKNHLYITQWIVIDYKALEEMNKNLSKEKLTLLEKRNIINSAKNIAILLDEVPGNIQSKDFTKELLSSGNLSSFNMPYFESSLEILGYKKFEKLIEDNPDFNPRKAIYKHFKDNISDLESFRKVMSYNGYKLDDENFESDPSSKDASNGIMARYDVVDGSSYGGIDYKIVNSDLVNNLSFDTKAGPTITQKIHPFEINSDTPNKEFLLGIPYKFDFESFVFGIDN